MSPQLASDDAGDHLDLLGGHQGVRQQEKQFRDQPQTVHDLCIATFITEEQEEEEEEWDEQKM